MTQAATDLINSPPHYTHGSIEPIDVIEDWRLPFHLANVLKYIARHEHKGSTLADIKKAEWYLARYRTLLEDSAFDREVSAQERRLCARMDDAFHRVDVALTDFVVSADRVEYMPQLPEVVASFDMNEGGEIQEVLR